MDNVPYEEWGRYIQGMLCKYGVKDGIVLELGCGTGTMTEILAGYGYDMIGVDNSEDMLELAMEKRMKSGHDILYLLQDMQEFELYGTVRAAVSVCDSVNYITEPEELEEVFRLVNNYLDPGGIFLFDFNKIPALNISYIKFQNIRYPQTAIYPENKKHQVTLFTFKHGFHFLYILSISYRLNNIHTSSYIPK